MPSGSSSNSGRVPKPPSQRRRRNKPRSYGAAEVTTAQAAPKIPPLGIAEPTSVIADMWEALQTSAEARFYSTADWQRARTVLIHGDGLMAAIAAGEKINAAAWKSFQDGLTELLVSPAAKRRAGIEMKPVTDTDEAEAEAQIAELQTTLRAVK